MNSQHKLIVALSLCAAAVPGLSFGALIDRGGGLIYDDDRNITWLADANYGAGSGYDNNPGNSGGGLMTWQNAMNWAANLSYYDSVRDVTYDDWRLPTTLQPDSSCGSQYNGVYYGYNCTGSEMGHLFYNELGGVAGQLTTFDGSLFTNVGGRYWSATVSGYPQPPVDVFGFFFTSNDGRSGVQDTRVSGTYDWSRAWAVRTGDVAAVPVPAAAWLFGSGLLGLIGIARRKAA